VGIFYIFNTGHGSKEKLYDPRPLEVKIKKKRKLVTKLSFSYARGSWRYTCATIQYGKSSDISSHVVDPDPEGP
jgi:hypothetical protein